MSNNDPRNGCQAYKSGYEHRFAGSGEQSEQRGIQRRYIFIMVQIAAAQKDPTQNVEQWTNDEGWKGRVSGIECNPGGSHTVE